MLHFPRWVDKKTLDKAKVTKRLDISYEKLRTIPSAVFKMWELRELYVAGNLLRKIPKEIAQLCELLELYVSGNRYVG